MQNMQAVRAMIAPAHGQKPKPAPSSGISGKIILRITMPNNLPIGELIISNSTGIRLMFRTRRQCPQPCEEPSATSFSVCPTPHRLIMPPTGRGWQIAGAPRRIFMTAGKKILGQVTTTAFQKLLFHKTNGRVMRDQDIGTTRTCWWLGKWAGEPICTRPA